MPAALTMPYLLPILMLLASNVFMTMAWYGHLRFKEVPLTGVILASWGIAFIEYCLAVPANRWGSAVYTDRPVEDHAGGHHAAGVCGLLHSLFEGAARVGITPWASR